MPEWVFSILLRVSPVSILWAVKAVTIMAICSMQPERLLLTIGQSNRVLIHLTVNYKASLLALSVKHYFEKNKDALEVLIFKGRKVISVSRELSESKLFYGLFMKKYFK